MTRRENILRAVWKNVKERVQRQRENGDFVSVGLPHGHTFLRLQDIRGYENLMFDMADEEPRLSIWTLTGRPSQHAARRNRSTT